MGSGFSSLKQFLRFQYTAIFHAECCNKTETKSSSEVTNTQTPNISDSFFSCEICHMMHPTTITQWYQVGESPPIYCSFCRVKHPTNGFGDLTPHPHFYGRKNKQHSVADDHKSKPPIDVNGHLVLKTLY